jgi:hypothetical protein
MPDQAAAAAEVAALWDLVQRAAWGERDHRRTA